MLTDTLEVPFPFIPMHENNDVWTMNFDEARSRQGLGVVVDITFPLGMTFPLSSRL
jgi:hypothetical protein